MSVSSTAILNTASFARPPALRITGISISALDADYPSLKVGDAPTSSVNTEELLWDDARIDTRDWLACQNYILSSTTVGILTDDGALDRLESFRTRNFRDWLVGRNIRSMN
jgi:hypothetical protein